MRRIMVLCGPSHSGKSTFAKRFKKQFTVISSDEIRKAMTGSYEISEKDDVVWKVFAARKNLALKRGENIILDACHLSKKARQHSLEDVDNRYGKTCIVFDLPFRVLKERCVREKRMTPATLEEIRNAFEKPTRRELLECGFDEVYFIREKKRKDASHIART
jgi:predicted kinase